MKTKVIAASIQQVPGSIAVTFRDVNDPENPNDFTLGGREPGIVLRFFGQVPAVVQAETYTLHLVREGEALPVAETAAPAADTEDLTIDEAMDEFKEMITETIKELIPPPVDMEALASLVAERVLSALPQPVVAAAEQPDPNEKPAKAK